MFSKMNLIQDEVRAEEAATIERWGFMGGDEDESPEEIRIKRDRENREREISNGSRISLHYIRATDLPHNKDVIMPGPAEIRQEIKIQKQISDHI